MRKATHLLAAFLIIFLCFQESSGRQNGQRILPGLPTVLPSPPQRLNADFEKIPLQFIPNAGQVDKQVAYYVQGRDKTVYFGREGLTFVLSRPQGLGGNGPDGKSIVDEPLRAAYRTSVTGHRPGGNHSSRWVVKLDFIDSNPDARPESLEKSGAAISYFKGGPRDWKAGLLACSKIIYRELWPGVDLLYSGTFDRMKYEFIVHPGADPSLIKMAYRGAEEVALTEEGRLEVKTPAGGFEDDVPIAYQEFEGGRASVKVNYALESPDSPAVITAAVDEPQTQYRARAYGFDVGEYDRSRTLVLDPAVLLYCGYIGGASIDNVLGVAVDSFGNVYVTGQTLDPESTLPVAVGPDLSSNGYFDGFVAKVDASGTALVYCGYIGGSDDDQGWGIAVDDSGNAYVTGFTRSHESDFPVFGGPDLTYNGGLDDAFVAKVDASGAALVYCGYIGGSDSDFAESIAVDGSGNAYVVGGTLSDESSFPVIGGPDLTFNNESGTSDVFVAKVDASGAVLVYCGYIGGSTYDCGKGIAVDGLGAAYIVGDTSSDESTFPILGGPDLTQNGGQDAFVAKVNKSGISLEYCGYIGGSNIDYGEGIAVDGLGDAYITGATYSDESSFPVTGGPDLAYNGGTSDAFVAKVDASGTGLEYCGYIGGSNDDSGNDVAIDGLGNAYVTGSTESPESTFPVRVGPDLTYNGGGDAYVAKVSASGTALEYCGYIGGYDWDFGTDIATDASGNAYVTGLAGLGFPVAVGPDLTYNGELSDGFVAKIPANPSIPSFAMTPSPGSSTVTAGESAVYAIQITPQSGSLDSPVTFDCTGMPSKCTAFFSPTSVTPGANVVTTMLTLATQPTSGTMAGTNSGSTGFITPALTLSLSIMILLFTVGFRKPILIRPLRRWSAAGAAICLIVLLATCSASNPPPYTGTPKGSHQITVQGDSGYSTASTTVTLIVR